MQICILCKRRFDSIKQWREHLAKCEEAYKIKMAEKLREKGQKVGEAVYPIRRGDWR